MSASEAYVKAGYDGIKQINCLASQILSNPNIRQAIDEKLGNFVKTVEDAIRQTAMQAFETEKHLMLTAENEFTQIKAAQDILDRAGLKPKEKLQLGGDKENPIVILRDASGKEIEDDESPIKDGKDS